VVIELVTGMTYEHMKGGRGKKALYRTVVVRIPEPLKVEVDRMVIEFHDKLVTSTEQEVDKEAVTGNNLVSAVQKIIAGIEEELPGFKLKSARQLIDAVLALKSLLK
jgi:hypothetical protein